MTTEFIRYTELSLLAEIGGYLGLLMGYSLLNVTKLFQVPIAKIVEEGKLFYFSASPWLGGLCNGNHERRGERLVFCKSIKMNRNE